MSSHRDLTLRRARRSYWSLVTVAVLAAGSLSSAIPDQPSALTGIRVGASGLVLVASVLLAARVGAAIDRLPRAARAARPRAGGDRRQVPLRRRASVT